MSISKDVFKRLIPVLCVTMLIPSGAQAWDEFEQQPDNVISVTVDANSSGDQNQDGDTELCDGFATISISDNQPASALVKARVGVESPTLNQRLEAVGFSQYMRYNGSPIFTLEEGAYSISPTWIAEFGQYSGELQLLDTDSDGYVDGDDATLASFDNLVYATAPFSISYDANSCIDSWDYADVYVERTPIQVRARDGWDYVWQDIDYDFGIAEYWQEYEGTVLDALSEGGTLAARAYLTRNTQIGGNTFTRDFASAPGYMDRYDNYPDDNYILSGEEGSTSLRAVTELFGPSINAQIRTQYGVWLLPSID